MTAGMKILELQTALCQGLASQMAGNKFKFMAFCMSALTEENIIPGLHACVC